jgi:hypothetical protein
MLLNVGLGVEIVGSVGSVGLSSLQAENRITPISITATKFLKHLPLRFLCYNIQLITKKKRVKIGT